MHGASMQATKEEKVETKEENEDGAESKMHKDVKGDAKTPWEALGLDKRGHNRQGIDIG